MNKRKIRERIPTQRGEASNSVRVLSRVVENRAMLVSLKELCQVNV